MVALHAVPGTVYGTVLYAVSCVVSTKYDGSNPNRATVGSSGHATGVP
jgi:hypothetical protein